MKKKKLTAVLVLGCALALALALVGCGSNSNDAATSEATSDVDSTPTAAATSDTTYGTMEEGTLKVISSTDFPPFENLEDGQYVGFEMDLIRAMGDELGLDVEISNQAFDSLVPAIAANTTADCAVSGITITPEREEEVAFTDPIIDSNQAIVVMSDSGITDVDQLNDASMTIDAQSGTTGSDWAKENLPNATVTDLQEATACFTALQAGQCNAVSIDLPVAAYTIKTAYPDATIIQETPTGEQYGIAVNKNNQQLLDALNDALQTLRDNGTYDQIYNQWFGEEE